MTVAPLGPVASTVMSAGSASWGEVVSRLIVTDPDEVIEAQSIESGPQSDVPHTHPPAFWFIFWGEFAERAS